MSEVASSQNLTLPDANLQSRKNNFGEMTSLYFLILNNPSEKLRLQIKSTKYEKYFYPCRFQPFSAFDFDNGFLPNFDDTTVKIEKKCLPRNDLRM
jgi:hypothetical protein